MCNCRKPEDLESASQSAPPRSIGQQDASSSVVGMARVVAIPSTERGQGGWTLVRVVPRFQAGLVKPAELPPPYEAPPSYKAAVAMSQDGEAPPPSYLLREAVIV